MVPFISFAGVVAGATLILTTSSLASNMFGKKQTRLGFYGDESRELSNSDLTDMSVNNLFRLVRTYTTQGP